jgi:glycosyltransferase involved in cell wall biosynthesis
MPAVSVIIPCYNARPWIAETLRSAQEPTAASTEIIVIDDGSTDGSGNEVREQFPDVRLLATPNRGVSHARNLGLELATGRFLVFLDADDLLLPGKIDRQAALLDSTQADVAYGNWQRLSPTSDGVFGRAEKVERAMPSAPEIALLTGFWCPTGAYLFRRTLVQRVGGFSPRLPVIQDSRFALDCALQGGRFVHDAHLSCLYRTHQAGSVSTRSSEAFWRDCLTSAIEVRDWWAGRGCLDAERLAGVMSVFDVVARATALSDAGSFAAACAEIEKHKAQQPPPARLLVRMVMRVLGYRRYRKLVARARNLWIPGPQNAAPCR